MAENTIIHEISLAGYKATFTGGADAEPTPELAAQVLEAALQAKADANAEAIEELAAMIAGGVT